MFKILKIWKALKKINKWHVCMLSRLLCLTLHDPMDCSPPGSSLHGILPNPGIEPTFHFPALAGRFFTTAAAAKSLQSCPTLCDPIDSSPPGSAVPGILQARTLEWVAISFSNAGKWKVKVKLLSSVRLFTTPWTAACQVPPSMGVSRQEYWGGVPLPSLSLPLVLPIKPQTNGNSLQKKRQKVKTTN